MTKQLKDLFLPFTGMTVEQQFEKVNEVRDTRSIERPAVATRRRKKEAKRSEKGKDKVMALYRKLSPEQQVAFREKYGLEEIE